MSVLTQCDRCRTTEQHGGEKTKAWGYLELGIGDPRSDQRQEIQADLCPSCTAAVKRLVTEAPPQEAKLETTPAERRVDSENGVHYYLCKVIHHDGGGTSAGARIEVLIESAIGRNERVISAEEWTSWRET